MSMVKESIDIDVPVGSAYNQWTQFEEFPRFMEGVEEVRQIDDRRCHWKTKVAGAEREFDTEIVDQLPDERIAWRSVSGDVRQRGVVSFQRLDDAHTRVSLAMDFEPQGMAEKAGDLLGVLDRRVKGDLKRFKGFIEERDHESGAWRGRIAPTQEGMSHGMGTRGPSDTSPRVTPDSPGPMGAAGSGTGTGTGAAPGAGRDSGPSLVDPDDMRHG